jgi:hypothetical protein
MDETLSGILAVLFGVLLRFGLPLAFTVLAAWGLRRLDQHWQGRSRGGLGLGHALGAGTLQVRCWEVMQCGGEARRSCPAYLRSEEPCWQVYRAVEGRLPERCLTCRVFREAPVFQGA